jgi:hypothetical protein
VLSVLEREIKEIYNYLRGHITPLGLFELLARHADDTTVLDDMSNIFRTEVGKQILLGALEPSKTPDRGRVVKYERERRKEHIVYRGGLICISNKELHDEELLTAIKSRVQVLRYEPSDAELGALMLGLAELGWPEDRPTITAPECKEVARFVITELLRRGRRFDLRLFFDKALPDYQQWKDGESECHWRDLVTASIEEQLTEPQHDIETPKSRAAKKAEDQRVLQEILSECRTREEQLSAWAERTGKSVRAFYRRLLEAE